MARWPSGVPVFRWADDFVVGTEVRDREIYGIAHSDDGDWQMQWERQGLRALHPLNADARAMIAIAKAGNR